jgi:beta-glucosidase
MPGKTRWRGDTLVHAVSSRKVAEHVLDERVRNVLELINYASESGIPQAAEERILDSREHTALLRQAASESIVLLKNKNILPFKKSKSVAVIGPNAKYAAYCGGGSAALPPTYTVTPFDGISCKVDRDVSVQFAQGIYTHQQLPLLGSSLRTARDNGEVGFLFKVYNDPPEQSDRECVDQLHLTDSYDSWRITSTPRSNLPPSTPTSRVTWSPKKMESMISG